MGVESNRRFAPASSILPPPISMELSHQDLLRTLALPLDEDQRCVIEVLHLGRSLYDQEEFTCLASPRKRKRKLRDQVSIYAGFLPIPDENWNHGSSGERPPCRCEDRPGRDKDKANPTENPQFTVGHKDGDYLVIFDEHGPPETLGADEWSLVEVLLRERELYDRNKLLLETPDRKKKGDLN